MPLLAAHELTPETGNQKIYNAFDSAMTFEIFQQIKLGHPGPNIAYRLERALQGPVIEMMLRGWRIDAALREKGISLMQQRLEKLDHVIDSLARAVWQKPLNPQSPKQLIDFFYNYLGIAPITVTVKGELKTPMNQDTLEKLSAHFELRLLINAILSRRQNAKSLSVIESDVDADGRMRTTYNIGGTTEGRFSSAKSPEGSGSNLQNITGDLRHMFVADSGWKIGVVDLEQADSRNVGWLCGILFDDWSYLDACESSDVHTAVARWCFAELPWTGKDKEDRRIAERTFEPAQDSYRQLCKKAGHAVNFYGHPFEISRQTGIPRAAVAKFIDKYFAAFPCIPRLHQWTAQQLQSKMQLTNAFGIKRDFFDRPNSDETLKKGLAFLAASATANALNLGMWRTWRHEPQIQLLAQLHDAFYFQFRETEDEAAVIKRVRQHCEVKLRRGNRIFVIPTDAKTGWSWGERWQTDSEGNKIEVNPKGLDKIGAAR